MVLELGYQMWSGFGRLGKFGFPTFARIKNGICSSEHCISDNGSLIGLVDGPNTSTDHVSHKRAYSIGAPLKSGKSHISGS